MSKRPAPPPSRGLMPGPYLMILHPREVEQSPASGAGCPAPGRDEPTPDLMPLTAVRRVWVSEPDEAGRLHEAFLKGLTSGEPVAVNPMPTGVALLFRRFCRRLQAAVRRARAPGRQKGETGTAHRGGPAFPLFRWSRKGRDQ